MKNQHKILIVDDVPKNIQVLGSILMKQKYQIAYAQSGIEALKMIRNNSFDLVLLDIMMPEMDGFEVCEHLKSLSETKDIPVVFLTAKDDNESITKGFNIGGNDFLTKPFNASEMLVKVKTQLDLRRKTILLEQYKKEKIPKPIDTFFSFLNSGLKEQAGELKRLASREEGDDNEKQAEETENIAHNLEQFAKITSIISSNYGETTETKLSGNEIKNASMQALEKFDNQTDRSHTVFTEDFALKMTWGNKKVVLALVALLTDWTYSTSGKNKALAIKIKSEDHSFTLQFATRNDLDFAGLAQLFNQIWSSDNFSNDTTDIKLSLCKILTEVFDIQIVTSSCKKQLTFDLGFSSE